MRIISRYRAWDSNQAPTLLTLKAEQEAVVEFEHTS